MDATKKRAEKQQPKGKPVDFKELLRMEPDGGTTNIRNVTSKHWTRWLGPEHRYVELGPRDCEKTIHDLLVLHDERLLRAMEEEHER